MPRSRSCKYEHRDGDCNVVQRCKGAAGPSRDTKPSHGAKNGIVRDEERHSNGADGYSAEGCIEPYGLMARNRSTSVSIAFRY